MVYLKGDKGSLGEASFLLFLQLDPGLSQRLREVVLHWKDKR